MGSSSKTTTSNQTQATSSTSTPTTTPQVSNSLSSYLSSVNNLATTNPTSLVAAPSANQTAAYTAGAGLDSTSSNYGTATGLESADSSVTPDQINSFMSPYLNDVVNSSLASYDKTAGATLAGDAAAGATNGAFGGSRYGILQANEQADSNLNRATLQSGLLNTGYNTAVSDALSNDQLGQTAAVNLTNTGSTADADNRANLTTQDALGQDQRSIAQASATSGLSLIQSIGALLAQAGVGAQDVTGTSTSGTGTASGTQTTTSSPSLLSTLTGTESAAGQTASTLGSLASFFA